MSPPPPPPQQQQQHLPNVIHWLSYDVAGLQATVDADRKWIMGSIASEFGTFDGFNAQLRAPLRDKVLEVVFMRCLRTRDVAALTVLEGLGVTLAMQEVEVSV